MQPVRLDASKTLIGRAAQILQAPPAEDPATALADATVVINAHRPSFTLSHCRACGESWECDARVEGNKRASRALQRLNAAKRTRAA